MIKVRPSDLCDLKVSADEHISKDSNLEGFIDDDVVPEIAYKKVQKIKFHFYEN